ncbi:hypothetical protein M569_13750, partial [Genlisea aurea]
NGSSLETRVFSACCPQGNCEEKQFFSPEFMAVMQDMIRKEVRNYMAGMEQQKGFNLQNEAVRNVVVKRMGISKID